MNYQVSSKATNGNPFGLTAQELRIIQLLCDGMRNIDIGIELGVTENSIKRHLSTLCDKLGVSNRLEVAMFAVTKGLVSVTTDGDGARRDGLLVEIEAVHRKIEKYVRRSRMLVQQLSSEAARQG